MKVLKISKSRSLMVPGNENEMLDFAVFHWFREAESSIQRRGFFAPALSGGSTPKAIYQRITAPENRTRLDWKRVLLFWSDERAVLPSDKESNYRMAMEEGGFKNLPIPQENIFRMKAEKDIEKNSLEYEKIILERLDGGLFDLVMLGLGEDGHTASLFPHTEGLHIKGRLVISNYVPEKDFYRMSLTFDAINKSRASVIYVLGEKKRAILKTILSSQDVNQYPITGVGTDECPTLFLADIEAAEI